MDMRTILRGLKFPEGPSFDSKGNLWFVEIHGRNLSRWDGEELIRYNIDGIPNGTSIDGHGRIWITDSGKGVIRVFDPMDHSFRTVCSVTEEGESLKRPNDLAFDSSGNLFFSDHADGRTEPVSTFCVLPRNGSNAKVIAKNKQFTNGLAFRGDGTTLLFSETYRQRVWMAEWDNRNLELHNERIFAEAGKNPLGPDGIAFDEEENLYVAIILEGIINVYNKDGDIIKSLKIKGSMPTSCAFDPTGRLGLVVTEAERGEILSFPGMGKGLSLFQENELN
ncbi:MAG: SMP-30/gluconolactonase/LRE family protein [Spirochaetes bacterium]|nr:SMP-30/gluconolactonase/LRE family protein [Spirochaetota bacterium]